MKFAAIALFVGLHAGAILGMLMGWFGLMLSSSAGFLIGLILGAAAGSAIFGWLQSLKLPRSVSRTRWVLASAIGGAIGGVIYAIYLGSSQIGGWDFLIPLVVGGAVSMTLGMPAIGLLQGWVLKQQFQHPYWWALIYLAWGLIFSLLASPVGLTAGHFRKLLASPATLPLWKSWLSTIDAGGGFILLWLVWLPLGCVVFGILAKRAWLQISRNSN